MIKVGAAGYIKFGEELWQRVGVSQGVNQPGLLLVAQERQVDAQAFFNSSLAFFKMSCSSCSCRTSRRSDSTCRSSSARSGSGGESLLGFGEHSSGSDTQRWFAQNVQVCALCWSLQNKWLLGPHATGQPTMPSDDEMRTLISSSSLSDWFRHALLSALERDPEEAAADAGLLSLVLDRRVQSLEALTLALKAIGEAQRSGST